METLVKKRIPWNKGKKGLQIAWNKGMKRTWFSPTEFKKGHDAKNFNWGTRTPWNKNKKGVSGGFPKGQRNTKISGENHYCWKGGITPLNRQLRRDVEIRLACSESKERDNYTCQMPECGIRGGKLESHHIKTFKEYPKLRAEITNLITLCHKCHNKTKHKEKQYEELFINIIKLKYNV